MRKGVFTIMAMITLLMLSYLPLTANAHTPSTLASILTEDGPIPGNVTESTDFFEGDTIWFLMKDDGENVTMRVSVDINGDGLFNQTDDVFSNWMNYSCELNQNGTETLDENCTVEFKHLFPANNSTGTYYYQVERRVDDNYTNSWINTIYVGVDVHIEEGLPGIGDCFGAGCEDKVQEQSKSESDSSELDLIKVLILISAMGVVGLSISIIRENRDPDNGNTQQKNWELYSEE